MTDIDEIREVVESAQDKKVFNLVDAIKGRSYPTDQVTIYLDAEAAYARQEIEKSLTAFAQAVEKTDEQRAEFDRLEEISEDLRKKIEASAQTFHLRGISPGHLSTIIKKVEKESLESERDEDAHTDAVTFAVIAPHIVRVVNAEGAADEHLYTPEEVEALYEFLPTSQFLKLDQTVQNLSLKSAYFDAATDAGFLPRS